MNAVAALQPARAAAPVPLIKWPISGHEHDSGLYDAGPMASLARIPVIAPTPSIAAPPAPAFSASPAFAGAIQRQCDTCEQDDSEERSVVRARLDVGAADDPFEREADAIAGTVMALRNSDLGPYSQGYSPGASTAEPLVQRACSTCSATKDDDVRARRVSDIQSDSEDAPRMRSAEGLTDDGTGESLAASESKLTNGGQSLSASTRSFFESRMGRDLSTVRIHQGVEAHRFNGSIGARAFTYRNHIWLGRNEADGPSFTMAHELAHVLQQTAPGPVGPEATPSSLAPALPQTQYSASVDGGQNVRRIVAYWQRAGTAASALAGLVPGASARHSAIHSDVQQQFVTANTGLVTEVRIPDAGTGSGCGYADFYRSNNGNVPGVEPDGPSGLRNLTTEPLSGQSATTCLSTWPFHPMLPATGFGSAGYHHTHRYPRINAAGALTNCDRAPTDAWIGDLKPGHNERERRDGLAQVEGYARGIERTAGRTPADCWRASARVMQGNQITIPRNLNPSRSGGWDIANLELRLSSGLPGGSDVFQPQPGPRGGSPAIRGRVSAIKDRLYTSGVWVYFVEPNPSELQRQFGRDGHRPNFTPAARRLRTILDCLKSHPNRRRSLCRRTDPDAPARLKREPASLRARGLGNPIANSNRPTIRRTVDDQSFSFPTWNAMRVGGIQHPQFASTNLRSVFDRDVPENSRNRIKFQNATVRAEDWFNANYGSTNHTSHVPAGTAVSGANGIVSQARQVERLEFWTDQSPVAPAAIFGRLRATFGNVFVRSVAAYERLKLRARNAFRSTRMRGGGGSALAAVARRVGVMVLTTLGGIMMRKIGAIILQCLERGFTDYMTRLTEGESMEELMVKFHEAQDVAGRLRDDVMSNFESLADSVIGPLRGWLDEIASAARVIGDVVGVATLLARGMRIATCLSGLSAAAVGAIVTCIASALDLVLSIFGVSPIDWIVGRMMQSCRSRRLLAQVLMASDLVQRLPQNIAREMITKLRDELPEGARDILCDPATLTVAPLTMADFDCTEGDGSGEADSDGGGGGFDGSGDTASEGTTTSAPGETESGASGGIEQADAGEGDSPSSTSSPDGGSASDSDTETGAAPGDVSVSSTIEGALAQGDPHSGQGFIESGVEAGQSYTGQRLRITITVNVNDRVFRNREIWAHISDVSTGSDGAFYATFYIDDADAVTFCQTASGTACSSIESAPSDAFLWSPHTGRTNSARFVVRGMTE